MLKCTTLVALSMKSGLNVTGSKGMKRCELHEGAGKCMTQFFVGSDGTPCIVFSRSQSHDFGTKQADR